MPSMLVRFTMNDGVKSRSWVRLRHDNNVKRWGTENPILAMQLSRILKVKIFSFSVQQSWIKEVQHLLWRHFGLRNLVVCQGEDTGREWWWKEIYLNRQIWRDSCWVQTSYRGKGGRQRDEQKIQEGEGIQSHLYRWWSFRLPLGLCSQSRLSSITVDFLHLYSHRYPHAGLWGIMGHVSEPQGLAKAQSIELSSPYTKEWYLHFTWMCFVPHPVISILLSTTQTVCGTEIKHWSVSVYAFVQEKQIECGMDGALSAACCS